MFEPRTALDLLSRSDLKFLGGTPQFDLWAYYANNLRLRVHDVYGNINAWDIFHLPLRDNNEVGLGLPEHRKVRGQWGDVTLTREQVNEIETYLRCFAPWVLASRSEEGGLTNE